MNICIVDDHLLMAQSIKQLLARENSEDKLKIYISPLDFLADNFNEWVPELIITALSMPQMDGLEMMDRAKQYLGRNIKFILLASSNNIWALRSAFRKGASAYLTKDSSEKEVLQAVRAARTGYCYLNSSVQNELLSHISFKEDLSYNIAPREKEVLRRICDGNTPKEIAYDMKLSINTVQSYIKNLLRKFKVNRTAEMILLATKNGTIS